MNKHEMLENQETSGRGSQNMCFCQMVTETLKVKFEVALNQQDFVEVPNFPGLGSFRFVVLDLFVGNAEVPLLREPKAWFFTWKLQIRKLQIDVVERITAVDPPLGPNHKGLSIRLLGQTLRSFR